MSEAYQEALEHAYELIEADKLAEAEAVLKPILEHEPNNVDAWWLYAHAVTDPEAARMALNQVLNLDGEYEGAAELLQQLDATYAEAQAASVSPPDLVSIPDEDIEAAEFFADEDDDHLIGPEDDFIFDEDIVQQEPLGVEQKRSRSPILIVIPLLLLVLAIVLIIAIINPFAPPTPSAATGTVVVQQALPTDSPANGTTSTLLPVASASVDAASAIEAALSEYEVVEGTVGILNTDLGATLIAGVCSSDSLAMADTLDATMDAIAGVAVSAGSEIDALGIALIDCAGESSVLRVIAVPDDTAAAYSAGDLDVRGFQAAWQPVA